MASHTSLHQNPQQIPIDYYGPKQTTIDLVGGILCNVCRLTFATKQGYDSHYRSHGATTDITYSCNICYKEFVGYPSFRGHCYTSHVIKERFQCEHCSKQFSKISNLKEHVNKIHKFKCPTCRKEFPSKKEMSLHRIIHNNLNNPPYSCNTCKIEIDTADECKQHVEKHLKFLYACPICNENITDKENAAEHMKKHFGNVLSDDKKGTTQSEDVPDDNGGIMCQICSLVLGDRVKFDAHFSCEHGDEDIVYMCVECGKSFEKYSVFKNHCNDHMSRNRYKCEICKKSFPRLSMLAAHTVACQAAGAARGQKVFACPQCHRRFAAMWRWRHHLRTAHDVHRQLPCPHENCDRTFDTPKQLIVHQQSHEIKNQNFCNQCRLVFADVASCERHIDMHKKKVFFCPVCKRNAKDKKVIINHIAKHFEVVSHLCRVCGKIYHSKRSLIEHLKTHKKVKSYSCSHCNKSFLKPSQLEQHVNTHTGVKPYKCPICAKSFSNYPNWVKHVRRMHHEESIYIKNPVIDNTDADSIDKEDSQMETAQFNETTVEKDFMISNNLFNSDTYTGNTINNNYQVLTTTEPVSTAKIEGYVTEVQHINDINIQNLINVETVPMNDKGPVMEVAVDEQYKIRIDNTKTSPDSFFNIIVEEVTPIKSTGILNQIFDHAISIGNEVAPIEIITDNEYGTTKDIQKEEPEPSPIADEQISSTHVGDKPHKCPICEKTFAKYSYMSKHVGRVHHIRSIDIKNLIIDHKDEGDDENLVMEKMVNDENETFTDKGKGDIDEQLPNTDKVKIQIKMNRLDSSKPFNCTICYKSFAKYAYMTKHIRKVHNKKGTDIKNLNTDHKAFVGDEVSAMETGADDEKETSTDIAKDNNNDQNTDKPHRCPLCEKSFAKYAYMTKHVRKVHNKKIINIKKALNDHKEGVDDELSAIETSIDGEFDISIDTIKDDNGFPNTDKFSNVEHLVNVGSKPHRCSTCDKSFARLSYLSKHIRTVHTKKGVDMKNLITDQKDDDGSAMDTTVDEENDTLTDHSKDDNDDQISNTDHHMDIGYKPYKCPMCKKSFAKDRYCRKHVRRVHYKNCTDINSPIFDPTKSSAVGTLIEQENLTVESQNYLKTEIPNIHSIVNIVNDTETSDCLNDIDDANASIDFANVRLENYIFSVQRDSPMDIVPPMPDGKYMLNDNNDSNVINKDLFKTSESNSSITKDIMYESKAPIGNELVNANGEAITLVEKDLFNANSKESATVGKDLFSGNNEQNDNPIDILEYIAEMPENNSLFVPVIDQEILSAPTAEPVSYPCEYGPEFSGGFDPASTAGFIDLDDHILPHIDPLLTINNQPAQTYQNYDYVIDNVIEADLLALGNEACGKYAATDQTYTNYNVTYEPAWDPPVITKLCDQYAYGYGEMPEASRVPIMNTDIF